MKTHIKFIIIISVLFWLNSCNAQTTNNNNTEISIMLSTKEKTIGIGRLQVSLNCDIPLYHSETGLVVDTLRFSRIDSGDDKGKYNTTTKFQLNPIKYYAGDSDIEANENISSGLTYIVPNLAFKVLRCTEDGYEIVVNEELFETAIIKNDDKHTIYTQGKAYWPRGRSGEIDEVWFLYETWENYLKRLFYIYISGQKLYNKINGKEIKSKYNSGKVIEVKGNWAKIKFNPFDDSGKQTAWLQWTDGKTILVGMISEVYF